MSRICALAAAALAMVLLAVAAGCGDAGGTPTDARDDSLEGRWVLTGYAAGGRVRALPDGVGADILFTDGRVEGRAPVNGYGGTYSAGDDGALRLERVVRTEMGGTPEQDAAETAFFAHLEATRAFTLGDGTLSLLDADGATMLTFAAERPSVVGEWVVTSYRNGSGAVAVRPGSTLTAGFSDDGALSGSAGVNRYRTAYETTPAASPGTLGIRIDAPAALTRMAGPAHLMRQEERFLAALGSARTVTFHGRDITLRTADDAVAVTMTPR